MSNTELFRLLKKGDILAFDEIYNRYARRLYAFIFRFIKQKADTEEIVQDVFMKLWETRENIDLYSSHESFIFTIAYNRTISLLRKKISERKYLNHVKDKQHIVEADNIIDEIQYNDLKKQVDSLLMELTPRQREIFMLSRKEGLTHKEIAGKLSISPNTVKNHLVTTLAFLKSKIHGNFMIKLFFITLFF